MCYRVLRQRTTSRVKEGEECRTDREALVVNKLFNPRSGSPGVRLSSLVLDLAKILDNERRGDLVCKKEWLLTNP